MKKKLIGVLFTLMLMALIADSKKLSGSRSTGSSRGSGGRTKTKSQPAPTSFSYPQPSAPKPTLFGWQEKPAQRSQTLSSWQSKPANGQSHSYPSSQTGLSGHTQPKQPPQHQENVQRQYPSQNNAQRVPQTNSQPGHSYPSSNGLSGNTGGSYPNSNANGQYHQHGNGNQQVSGHGYPQQQGGGVSGSGVAPPPYQPPANPHQSYNGGYQNHNYGNQYHHPAPPPPYNMGSNYGGYGGYNPGYAPQMPGYFGNYGKGFGGPSRTGTALKGVGIAGAGVGTLLTGLALWNLARSTGHSHHTVVYDNRGQPVAVAPSNDTTTPVDSMLADLSNCSLTISNENTTEILAIPCAIATSFSPDATVQDVNGNAASNDNTKCTVTVLTKAGKEYMTTIPCSILLNTAADNNVTEPQIAQTGESFNIGNITTESNPTSSEPVALKLVGENNDFNKSNSGNNCAPEPGDIRDPINPCYSVKHDLTVIPLLNSTTMKPIDQNEKE